MSRNANVLCSFSSVRFSALWLTTSGGGELLTPNLLVPPPQQVNQAGQGEKLTVGDIGCAQCQPRGTARLPGVAFLFFCDVALECCFAVFTGLDDEGVRFT